MRPSSHVRCSHPSGKDDVLVPPSQGAHREWSSANLHSTEHTTSFPSRSWYVYMPTCRWRLAQLRPGRGWQVKSARKTESRGAWGWARVNAQRDNAQRGLDWRGAGYHSMQKARTTFLTLPQPDIQHTHSSPLGER